MGKLPQIIVPFKNAFRYCSMSDQLYAQPIRKTMLSSGPASGTQCSRCKNARSRELLSLCSPLSCDPSVFHDNDIFKEQKRLSLGLRWAPQGPGSCSPRCPCSWPCQAWLAPTSFSFPKPLYQPSSSSAFVLYKLESCISINYYNNIWKKLYNWL